MTDDSSEEVGLFEERTITQFPTIGPSLLVRWFIDGSVVVKVGTGFGKTWAVSVDQFGDHETGSPTVIRLKPQ